MEEKQNEAQNLKVDPGFGTKSITRARIILPNGRYNVVRRGKNYYDAYLFLVGVGWLRFLFMLFIGFLILNSVFACMYILVGVEQLSGIQKFTPFQDFLNALYFSVQTFTTVGYGAIHPQGVGANLISIINAFTGLMGFALATGLLFARFARPGESILFSNIGVIAPWKEKQSAFMFRIANLHNNKMVDVEADVLLTWLDEIQGSRARRYKRIDLFIDKITMFPVNWTVVHIIDETSPLYGKTVEEMDENGFEIIAHVKGYDETYAQRVNASHSYKGKDLRWGKKFKLMYENKESNIELHLDQINDLVEAPLNT